MVTVEYRAAVLGFHVCLGSVATVGPQMWPAASVGQRGIVP